MNSPPVILPPVCAPRERLLRLFDERADKQFVYIQAPAGYGKTISTLLWLRKTQVVFSWMFLDKYDNVLSMFYRSLCRSILTVFQASQAEGAEAPASPAGDILRQYMNNPSFSSAPVESAIEFISLLSWREGKYALILDDLHNITSGEILKSLPYVLKRLPAFVNVLLLSRTDLPGAMRPMLENDKTGFISASELTFSPDEIRSHFISYGWFITLEKAAEIHAYTDGWVIILSAMVISENRKLSYKNQKPTLDDYFEKNMWEGFDAATQTFLLKTSIVDSFTAELCEMLTESRDCAGTLDNLLRGNINLSRLGTEYRFHNLFLEFLRGRLTDSGIDQKKLFSTAANYYLQEGQFFKAAECAMRQDNPQLRMQIIQTFFQSKNPALGQFLELSQLFDPSRLPKEAYDRSPILYMPVILAAFLQGRTAEMKGLFDRFYAVIPAFINTGHPIAGSIVARLLLDYRMPLTGVVSFLDSMNIKRDREFPGQAAVVTVQMPMLHRSVRDFYEFLDAGVMEALSEVFSCILPDGDFKCFYHSVAAGLLMEQNRLSEAMEEALSAYNNLTEKSSNEIRFGVSAGLAEIYALTPDDRQNRSVLAELRHWIEDHQALHLLKNLEAYEKRLLIWDDDGGAAKEWLENYFISDVSYGEFDKIYQNFTTVRACIALGRIEEAEAVLWQLKKLGTEMARPLDVAEADVLKAIVQWVTGRKKEAGERMLAVLAGMRHYGFIRVVANEGKAVLPILTLVIKKLEKETEKDEPLYRFVKKVQVAAYERSKYYAGLTGSLQLKPVKLSPKQTIVLEFLSKGYKNAEIVRDTGLSINTIREHTRILYRKLEVTNAMDAIIKARQLGLLP